MGGPGCDIAAVFFSEWSIPDWISVVGLPLALIGLYLAAIQLRKTTQAANAARDAVREAERHLADNHLLLLIPRLVQVARDLQSSVERNQREPARTCLTDWREAAVQVRTLVERQGGYGPLIERIDKAVALVASAEDGLHEEGRDAANATRHVRDRIRDAGDLAMQVVTERMAFVRREL